MRALHFFLVAQRLRGLNFYLLVLKSLNRDLDIISLTTSPLTLNLSILKLSLRLGNIKRFLLPICQVKCLFDEEEHEEASDKVDY